MIFTTYESMFNEVKDFAKREGRGVQAQLAKVISFDRARKLAGKGCLAYLSHIRDVDVESTTIESIMI